MKGFKMSYSNGMLSESTSGGGKDGKDGLPGVGFKLTPSGDFDLQSKRLTNVAEGTENSDAITKHQVDTLKNQLRADSLQVDGSSHMTGDLDLRGQKLINPGEIRMNRKLITNLDTDEDNDLSAVNMITLKKFHPTHEVTKDIDLKELFNVVQSKQRSLNELKTHYDSLVSFEEVKENFLSRQEEFPMETQLNMNHNSITNLKDPEFEQEAATKKYADGKLALAGGRMQGSINMSTFRIKGLGEPTNDANAATKKYVDNLRNQTNQEVILIQQLLDKKIDIGEIDQNSQKIINLGTPTDDDDAATKKYADEISKDTISTTSHPKDEFRYLMEDVDESSSESNIFVTGIVDFQQSPHKINKKAYAMKISKRSSDNMFLGRIGFNMFRIPEGEYTICVEFFPGKMDGVSVSAVSTALNVGRQATKVFANYSRSIIHMHKWRISPPEYLMLDLKWQGKAEDSSPGDAHLIIYGVKEFQADVASAVFDAPFVIENGEMVMETDLNLNGKRLLGAPKSKAVILGQYRKATDSSSEKFTINGETQHHVFGFDFRVKKITLHYTIRDGPIAPAYTSVVIATLPNRTEKAAFGEDIGNNAISYSFDFAVAANKEFELSLRNRGGIARANVTILIEME